MEDHALEPYFFWPSLNISTILGEISSDEFNFFGSFYLKKDNSIGLNFTEYSKENLEACVDFIRNNFTPQKSEPSMVPNYFYVNIAYSNKEALRALQVLGFDPLQISLRLLKW